MPIPVTEIVDSFKDRNCVLLLGPGLAKNKKGEPLQSGLIKFFKEKQLEIEEDIDNLYACKKQTKTRAYGYLKEYYRDHGEPNDLHRQLALIPCRLYISINPDSLMKQALDDYGVEHEFKYYAKGQTPEEVVKPTAEKPVLYNLFGSIENQQSLIFTFEDLIQYLFSIIKEFKLPQNLRDAVENSPYFIFLGFDFEKWYLKLLLKLFLDEDKLSIATEAEGGSDEKLRTFYKGHYGLEFVDTGLEEYVRSLYAECSKRGLLRTIKEKTTPSIQDEIKELIKQDEVEKALDRLYQFLEKMDEQAFKDKAEDKQEWLDELDGHSAKYNRNEKNLRKGTISEETAKVEKNKIIEAVQEMIKNLGV